MKFKLENQDGVYFLDVFINKTNNATWYKYGTMILDMKKGRNRYYLVPRNSENKKMSKEFISFMEKLFICDLVPKKRNKPYNFNGDMAGNLAENALDIFLNIAKDYGVPVVTAKLDEEKLQAKATEKYLEEEKRYYYNLKKYNEGHYPERKILNQ